MYTFVAKDANGIPRVYGKGSTPDIAESLCRAELLEYVQHRREMCLDEFTIEPESR